MSKIKRKKRYVTLIEMMIVMFLIAMITGVIAYNYRGSLEEGKAFKTKAGIEKLRTILTLKLSDDPDLNVDSGKWEEIIKASPLVQNSEALIRDGWGDKYAVSRDQDGEIKVVSDKYNQYVTKNKHGTMFGNDSKGKGD